MITPNRFPGTLEAEEVKLDDRTLDGNPTVDGAVRFVGDDFVGKTSTGVKSLTFGTVLPWRDQDFTPTAGQVTFILSMPPTDPKTLTLTVNGVTADEGADYTVSGVTITWLDVPYVMQTTDLVSVRYR